LNKKSEWVIKKFTIMSTIIITKLLVAYGKLYFLEKQRKCYTEILEVYIWGGQ